MIRGLSGGCSVKGGEPSMSFKAPSAFSLNFSRAFRDEGQVNGSVFNFIGVRYEDSMSRRYFQMCIVLTAYFWNMLRFFIFKKLFPSENVFDK